MATKIFVVEDHADYRKNLLLTLSRMDRVEICGSSSTAEEALESLPGTKADIVIVDMSLPKMNGLDFAVAIKKQCPNLRCLMLSGHKIPDFVERARELGLQGYVLKGDTEELKEGLHQIIVGQSHFPHLEHDEQRAALP